MQRNSTDAGVPADYPRLQQHGPGKKSDGASPRQVLLMDCCRSHQGLVQEVVAACGATVSLCDAQSLNQTAGPSRGQILLVALEREPTPDTPVLPILRAFKQQGLKVLAFGAGLQSWTLRGRCLPLLAGAFHLLDCDRPEFESELHRLLSHALEAAAQQEAEERRLKERMAQTGVFGDSPATLAVFRAITRVSPLSDLPVLLTGETGTGKELLARAVHALDPKRCRGPFVVVNCAALSPTLAESELFGHRRGAFTGADRDRKGLIRAAHEGVLFLDEIGELSLDLQPKLLRVLQEYRVLSLGEEHEAPVSVRVIAATNRDLRDLITAGRFRADLFHRLNILPVRVPALRERPGDVEPLVRCFMAKHRALRPGEALEVAPEFIEALRAVDLPGNVRQLENLVRQALVNKKPGLPLGLSDLTAEIWQRLCAPAAPEVCLTTNQERKEGPSEVAAEAAPIWENLLQSQGGNLARCLKCCERALLSVVLQRSRGNQSQVARALGITARSVYNKVRRYGLQ